MAAAYQSARSYRVEAEVTRRVLGEAVSRTPVHVTAGGPEREVIDVAYEAPNHLRLSGSSRAEVIVFHDWGVSRYSGNENRYMGMVASRGRVEPPNSVQHRAEALTNIGFADYSAIENGMADARALRRETVEVDGRPVDCTVIEASYARGTRRTFWVDTVRNLVLREVRVVAGAGLAKGAQLEYTVTVRKLSWNEPLDSALFEFRAPAGMKRPDGTVQPGPNGVVPPVLLGGPQQSELTAEALIAHLSGGVYVRFTVDERGQPTEFEVARPLGLGLDERAVQCVTQLSYEPAMKDGKPVRARVGAMVSFTDPVQPGWHLGSVSFQPEDGATRPVFLKAPYPDGAGERQRGTVALRLTIDAQGVPRDIQAIGAADGKMARKAVAIVGRWRFRPGERNGEAVAAGARFELVQGHWSDIRVTGSSAK